MRHTGSTLVRILRNAWIPLLCLALLVAIAPTMQAQSTVYAMTSGGQFGSLSLTSGTFTAIGPGCSALAGMGGLGSNLYGGLYTGSTLYQINVTAGTCTAIGSGSISSYVDFGSTTGGLYAVGADGNLYSVNASNGATTLIGATGLPGGAANISSDGPSLYAVAGENLYSLNTSTGAATVIGSTGVGGLTSLTYAVVSDQPQLFSDSEAGELYSINIMTGTATPVASTGEDFFGMAIPASTYSVLHSFSSGNNGSNPFAGLVFNATGNVLYGSTGAGGTGTCSYSGLTGCGTFFSLKETNGNWTFDPLYSFLGGSTDGEFPVRPVTIASNGTAYGATLGGGVGSCSFDGDSGCGIVFNVGPSPTPPRTPLQKWTKRLPDPYHFTGESDGGIAFTTVIFDSAGNLYGTTVAGGQSTACTGGCGTVFKLTNNDGTYTESVIWNFAGGTDGSSPFDGLIFDTAGNLYGTTAAGGSTTACAGEGCGIVFELSPSGSSWTEKILYPFQGGNDGKNPNSGVVMDGVGNLYGNTWQGGSGGGGTVWELSPSGGGNYTFNLLYSVIGNGFAVGRLARDSNGNLYGALQNGGAFNNAGQIFKLTPSASMPWPFTDLYDFTGESDGGNPIGGVVLDSNGNIYGTALFGGANNNCGSNGSTGCGDVWKIVPTN